MPRKSASNSLARELRNEKWHRVADSEDAGRLLIKACNDAIEGNAARRAAARAYASLFEGLELTSFDLHGYRYDNSEVFPEIEEPLIKNTCRSIGMTTVAKLTANDTPLAQFMSNRGGWREQTKSIRMDRLVAAEVEQPQGHFATLHELHRHGATLAINVTGTYLGFFFAGDDGVRVELDDSLACGIDQTGRFGRIEALVRSVYYSADDLAADFPDFEDEIFDAEQICMDGEVRNVSDAGNDLRPRRGVRVCQGWFCAYKKNLGREMWVLEDGDGGLTVLRDRDYKRKKPPMVKWDYERELYGVWGVPQTRMTYEQCMRENRMLCDMDDAERNSPQCCIVLPVNAEKEGDLNEARGWHIIRSNTDPSKINFVAPPKYNEMTASFVDRMNLGAHECSGVSQSQAHATKALGTTSGKHEHMVAALSTERFADQERRLIQCRAVDTAIEIVHAIKDLLEDEPSFSRVWSNGDKSEEIKPADLDLDVSKYTICIAPVSEDKDTPKARLDKADSWLENGVITGSEWAAIQDTLATQEKGSELIAQESWVSNQIEKWQYDEDDDRLEETWYQGPDKWIDLATAARQVSNAKIMARQRGAPPDVLYWFDKFLAECSDFIDQEKAQGKTSIAADASEASILFPGVSDQQAAAGGAPPAAPPAAPPM